MLGVAGEMEHESARGRGGVKWQEGVILGGEKGGNYRKIVDGAFHRSQKTDCA